MGLSTQNQLSKEFMGNILANLSVLISGITCGVIIFQVSAIASTVFKVLKPEESSVLLRSIFPKFFKILIILSTAFLCVNFLNGEYSSAKLVNGILSLILAIICLSIIPITNKSRDDGNQSIFRFLHSVSVVSTLIILFLNFSWIFII